MRLLLLSNSTLPGEAFLSWPTPYLADFLSGKSRVLFVPYAAVTFDFDAYTARVAEALSPLGVEVESIHNRADKAAAVATADSLMVGGGNTFALLARLQAENLLAPIREAVQQGTPYTGWSAGANLACPTIKTTNDMPIMQPQDFRALNLIPFQINPHYTEKTISGHGGESRQQRLAEFLAANPGLPVLGLPEGKLLRWQHHNREILGVVREPAIWLEYGKEPVYLDNRLPAG